MGPEAQGKGSIMKKVTRITAALIVCMALGVTTAAAAPRGNGEGHAYAWGLYKDRGQVEVVEPAPVEPVTELIAPAPLAPEWENVTMYLDPAQVAPYVVPLYTATKSGHLGFAQGFADSLAEEYLVDGAVAYRTYRPAFSATQESPATPAAWDDAAHRITYAYPGFTTVTWGGVSYPVDSAEAVAAMSTPGIEWQATYREMWDATGYLSGGSFNAWAVVEYAPAP